MKSGAATELESAAIDRDLGAVRRLLANGTAVGQALNVSIDAGEPYHQPTSIPIIKLLLQAKADMCLQDTETKSTPLHRALFYSMYSGFPDSVISLMFAAPGAGESCFVKDDEEYTPVDVAVGFNDARAGDLMDLANETIKTWAGELDVCLRVQPLVEIVVEYLAGRRSDSR